MTDPPPSTITPKVLFHNRIGLAVVVVLVVALGGGVAHRLLAARIGLVLNTSLPLARPLSSLPLNLEGWTGEDVPLDPEIERVAGEDEFVNRRYRSGRLGRTVNLYIGYVGRPRSRLSHRPDLCYPVQGWEKLQERRLAFQTRQGSTVPGTLYEFRSPDLGGPRDLVLATYLVNGQFSGDRAALGAYNSRQAAPLARHGVYLARIQMSLSATGDGSADSAVLADFASTVVDPITSLMPGLSERSSGRPATR
jgi:hypothetical protein